MKRFLLVLMLFCCALVPRIIAQPMLGDAVVTCGAINGSDPVVGVIGVQTANTAPWNVNWLPPSMFHAPAWNRDSMGQVFGIALDKAGNIFVTATVVYPIVAFGPAGSGAIYRIDRVTNQVTVFATLPNTGGVGLGNICYDPDHNTPIGTNGLLWVTNFEDGKIYGLDAASGALAHIYDPFAADVSSPGFAPRSERVWGIGYRNHRLYFGRWREDMNTPSTLVNNEIWSVPLNVFSGAPIPPAVLERVIPNFGTQTWSNHPSDIEFSASGRMLVAERGWWGDFSYYNDAAHSARMLEFVNLPGWPAGNVFTVGQVSAFGATGNSAGGCDYGYRGYDSTRFVPLNCDSTAWGSGNALHFLPGDYIYGEQMFPATGGSIANSVLIDLDGNLSHWGEEKNFIGDIDIYKNCSPAGGCDSVSASIAAAPNPAEDCCWDLTITNNYSATHWIGIRLDIITAGVTFTSTSAPPGWSLTSTTTSAAYTPTTGFVPLGVSGPFHFCIMPGSPPPQKIKLSWIGRDGSLCVDTLTIECDSAGPCGSLTNVNISCATLPPSTPSYTMTFQIHNGTTTTISGASVTVTSPMMGVSVTGGTLSTIIPSGGTSPTQTVTINGGAPGSVVCLLFQLYDQGKKVWCTFDTCVVLPRCANCCDGHRITLQTIRHGASLSGNVLLAQSVSTIPNLLRSFTVTIVSATRKTVCPTGVTGPTPISGTFVGGSFNTTPVMGHTPFGTNTITWGTNVSGVLVSGTPLSLVMSFPPPPSRRCRDTIDYCLRYTYTDTACNTCDTTICYRIVRRGSIFSFPDAANPPAFPLVPGEKGDDDIGEAREKEDEHTILGGNDPARPVRITMTNQTNGTLTIDNPALDQSDPDGAITILSVEIEPEVGVDLTSVTDNTSGQLATITNRVAALVPLNQNIVAGTSRSFALVYDNSIGALSFRNIVRISYFTGNNNQEVYEAMAVVYARTPNGFGGDLLEVDNNISLTNVRTYGLKFTNGNNTGDKICRVVVSIAQGQGDGDDIVAVGPGIDRTEFGLKAFKTTEPAPRILLLAEEPASEEAAVLPLDPNAVVTPIYVTVCGGADDDVTFSYTTYTPEGEVVSTGTVTADNPLLPGTLGVDDPARPGIINSVDCAPNPATDMALFTLTLHRADPTVWLAITDINGNLVATVLDAQEMPSGTHRMNFDLSALPSGMYLYTLHTSTQTQTRKLQIVR